jgi:endonuclease G, mitochondrial
MKKLLLIASLSFLAIFSHGQSVELVLGDPSPTAVNSLRESAAEPLQNLLAAHAGYVLSFNPNRREADWVTWHVQKSDLGKQDRANTFRADEAIPGPYRIGSGTFGSTYDRGHMCPSGDRTNTFEANTETFLMSNMEPQHKDLNRQTWRLLEEYIRSIVNTGMEAYVYAGCAGGSTRLSNGMTIPSHCWKVVLFLKQGAKDLSRITRQTSVLAVDMPNDGSTKGKKWTNYQTTAQAIENLTGLRFFRNVSDSVSDSLRKKIMRTRGTR